MNDWMAFILCMTIAACGCLIYTAIHRLIDTVNDLTEVINSARQREHNNSSTNN